MPRPAFSCVVPTLGRSTLPLTLASINREVAEVIVVADTFEMREDMRAAIRAEAMTWGARYYEVDAGYHDWGSPQLQEGYAQAKGEWILNCGDDDIYEPYAFETMMRVIRTLEEPIPLMFRTVLHPSPVRGNTMPVVLWHDPELRNQNITGQCLVIPNEQEKIGRWDILVDYGFITSTVDLWGGKVGWRTDVLSQCY